MILDVGRKGHAPQEGLLSFNKEDSTHARLGGINRTNRQRVVRHELSEACGVSYDALGEQFKVCQVVSEVLCDVYTVLVSMGKAKLKCAKEACAAEDGSPHETKFAKDLLPGLDDDMPLSTEVIENGKYPGFSAVS